MFFLPKRITTEREERSEDDDRDLIALVNEARTPRELGGVVTLARMRHSRD